MTTPEPDPLAVGDDVTAAWTQLVSDWIASAGIWTPYTPSLGADTTNPTLGTGNKRYGKSRQIGKTVHAQGTIVFGSAGVSAGSGSYTLGMPVAPAPGLGTSTDPAMVIGNGWISVSGDIWPVSVVLYSSAAVHMHYFPTGGTRGIVGAAIPAAWSAGDFISFDVEYEAL